MVDLGGPNRANHAAVFPGPWVRALLPTAVLACVDAGPLHGYAIAQALGELGFGVPKGGSLYPALARLEEDGALEAAWVPGPSGPARREYTLTAQGYERLEGERALLAMFTARLDASVNRHDGVTQTAVVVTGSALRKGASDVR
ncbi:PadR family transcriptional regulator [Nocardioides alcanivorans]|uniref:PadR family transcriptional regulator n=1 Tax=Nocardioides alcanivorans TaxID=2897352 RepID=UPI0035D5B1CD